MSEPIVVGGKGRVFVGRVWKNQTNGGLEVINIHFDKNFEITLKDINTQQEYKIPAGQRNACISGFPNKKRELNNNGTPAKDADFRLSITTS